MWIPGLLLDVLALTGGTVHPMLDGLEPAVNDVLIEDGRVLMIGAELELPEGARVVDATGLHLVPGLIDGMVSYDPDHDILYIASGITTLRDMGGEAANLAALRAPELRDRTPGPHLLSAGAVLDGQPPASSAAVPIGNEQQLEASVSALANSFQVDFLSIQPGFGPEFIERLGALATELRLDVWGMRPRGAAIEQLGAAGWDGLLGLDGLLPEGVQWSFVQPGALDAPLEQVAAAGIAIVPVASELARFLRPADLSPESFEHLGVFYEGQWRAEWRARGPLLTPEYRAQGERIAAKRDALFQRLVEAEIELLPGSGAPLSWVMPGASLLDELDAWVAAGMAPAEVLARATRDAARLIGEGGRRGVLAPGRTADIVLLPSDPRESLAGFRAPAGVVVRGQYLDAATIEAKLAELAARHGAVRESLSAPLEIEPPSLPEGAVVLAGQVETFGLDARLSGERFAVVREPDGRLAILGRLRVPASASVAESQLEIGQRLRDGLLDSFLLTLTSGDEVLTLEGLWEPDTRTFRTERRINGGHLATQTTPERPRLVTLDPITDSITSALVLSQIEADGELAVFDLGAQLEPNVDTWIVEHGVLEQGVLEQGALEQGALEQGQADSEQRAARVRVRQGMMEFRYGAGGAPLQVRRAAGRSEGVTRAIEELTETFGGAGLPVQFSPAVKEALPLDAALELAPPDAPAPVETDDSPQPDDGDGR